MLHPVLIYYLTSVDFRLHAGLILWNSFSQLHAVILFLLLVVTFIRGFPLCLLTLVLVNAASFHNAKQNFL